MKRTALVCFLLCGCGNDGTVSDFLGFNQKVVGNEVSVQVTNVQSQVDAFPIAEKHCRQYGRAARYATMSSHNATFDCVKTD
jgi:hypothetical protein